MTVACYRRMGKCGHWKFIGCVTYQNTGPLPFKVSIPYLKNWQHAPLKIWYKMHQDPKLAARNVEAVEAWRDYRPGYPSPEQFRPDARRNPDEKKRYPNYTWRKKKKLRAQRAEHLQQSLF